VEADQTRVKSGGPPDATVQKEENSSTKDLRSGD
jgi:hypothetical protein